MKKQTKKQLRKEYNALSIECHHLITEQLRELKELQKLYDEKDNEIKQLRAQASIDSKVLSAQRNEIKELREDTFVQAMRYKTVQEMSKENKDLRAFAVSAAETIREKANEIKELELRVRNLLDGKEIKALLEDAHLAEVILAERIDEKDREIAALRRTSSEEGETLKKLFGGRVLWRWVPEKDGV